MYGQRMEGAFNGFDWDAGNREKCARHGLSADEIQSVFLGTFATDIDRRHSIGETRWRAIGRLANGRHVFVVFTVRERDGLRLIRPISARFMHQKEVRQYEATKQTGS